ncbi:ABC transporter permease [Mucilaginibacter sp. HD30]
MDILISILAGAVSAATPVLFVVLGEIITERSGIINLGIEGTMLSAALVSVAVSYYTGSPFLAIICAMLAGGAFGALHALGAVRFNVNQIALGLAVTILGTGLSAYFGIGFVGKKITSIGTLPLPYLSKLPFIGPVLFSQNIFVYASMLLVPLTGLFFSKTRWGLEVTASGDDPAAALKSGVPVSRIRTCCTIIGAAIGSLGGAYIALVYTQGWIENMTQGRGLIGIGLVIFSFWSPWRAYPAVLLYGIVISLQLYLQAAGIGVSPFILEMCQYIVIILALSLATYRLRGSHGRMPQYLGKPFLAARKL